MIVVAIPCLDIVENLQPRPFKRLQRLLSFTLAFGAIVPVLDIGRGRLAQRDPTLPCTRP